MKQLDSDRVRFEVSESTEDLGGSKTVNPVTGKPTENPGKTVAPDSKRSATGRGTLHTPYTYIPLDYYEFGRGTINVLINPAHIEPQGYIFYNVLNHEMLHVRQFVRLAGTRCEVYGGEYAELGVPGAAELEREVDKEMERRRFPPRW